MTSMQDAAVAGCMDEADRIASALDPLSRIADMIAVQVDQHPEAAGEMLRAIAVARRCVADSADNYRHIGRKLAGLETASE